MLLRHECSECGRPWKDCIHVTFEDVYAARKVYVLRWAALVTVVALIAGGFMLAVMAK